ncbi:MAG TPA: hypothetical protein VF456_02535 [Vicinamibacterales bacterium]
MPRHPSRALAFVLGVLTCLTAAFLSTSLPQRSTRTEDLNRDGRPDVWRAYGRDGRIARVAVDTNFDGRSDVEELYENGILVRRQTDRNFDDQIDLVQDFDPATRQIVRSLTDVNADGVADLLVLFQNGTPVFSKWMSTGARDRIPETLVTRAAAPSSTEPPAALHDPFSGDLAYTAVRVDATPDEPFSVPAPIGPAEAVARSVVLAGSAQAFASDRTLPATTPLGTSALRGPPASCSANL